MVRKVTRAKWDLREGLAEGEIPSDAVSVDLRTQDNSLSFWTCDDPTPDEIRRAVLALAAAADRCDRMDVAWVEETSVQSQGLAIESTEGRTPVASVRHRHVDLVRLDAHRLVRVASLVADALDRGQHRRLTKREVVDVVAQAVGEGLVALDDLAEGVRAEVQRNLGS
jgi:hypothetical protein